jgi:hypothetical protein
VIRERAAVSVLSRHILVEHGFSKAQQRPPGLLLPVHSPDGKVTIASFRPDIART